MNHADFIVWVCLYPVSSIIFDWIRFKIRGPLNVSDNVRTIAVPIEFGFYVWIATKLW